LKLEALISRAMPCHLYKLTLQQNGEDSGCIPDHVDVFGGFLHFGRRRELHYHLGHFGGKSFTRSATREEKKKEKKKEEKKIKKEKIGKAGGTWPVGRSRASLSS
jgi:hypothetical protein